MSSLTNLTLTDGTIVTLHWAFSACRTWTMYELIKSFHEFRIYFSTIFKLNGCKVSFMKMALFFCLCGIMLLPLIIIQLFYVIPYSFIILAPSLREIKKDVIRIAASLGKNRFQRLVQIKLPIIMSSFLTSFAIGMLVSFSLYIPVYFIGAGRVTTLTVEALNLALSGSRQDLGVATFFQIIIPILILITVAYFNKKMSKWRF